MGKPITLAEAIRRMQEFKAPKWAWLQGLQLRTGTHVERERDYDEATGRSVSVKTETVYVSALSERDRAAELDALRDRFDRLNDVVETANHQTMVEWSDSTPTEGAG